MIHVVQVCWCMVLAMPCVNGHCVYDGFMSPQYSCCAVVGVGVICVVVGVCMFPVTVARAIELHLLL